MPRSGGASEGGHGTQRGPLSLRQWCCRQPRECGGLRTFGPASTGGWTSGRRAALLGWWTT
eukprot:13519731-Ditylum_brightwellii.AAC.1